MRFKICFDNDDSLKYIYQIWFREMRFDEEDLFEFVGDVHNSRGIMRVRHAKGGHNSCHIVHKRMFVPVEPRTKLGDWI